MVAPKEIVDLVERFDHDLDAYRSGQYNEAQLRQEFINPFFKALGWDMDNEQGYAQAYKDVIHEDSVKIDDSTKAPDYGFRIGGSRKFFVEAKKPSVNIDKDIGPAYQLRRYAWSANLPLSILSDFEELAVYDCRFKPVKTDKASKARTVYIKYTEYIDRWDEIASIFSREAVLKGSFDKYVESSKRKKGTAEVDNAFLQEIESWREMLAQNIALRNQELTTRDLNYVIQATIDRIVFLRICEDRGIEKYGNLQTLLEGDGVYSRLCECFRQADERYNSGLFHFQEDSDRQEPPDELSLNLNIDDTPLKEILKNLYYPDSPYEFSVLPAEILGRVYEQFLGKVIRLTEGHRAKVEYKPEVRKAGGVYYTPSYIVDYIVENTVGKLLKGSTPKKASELKILDPACGSGSFLIGAYQHLLDWHRDWYVDNVVPLLDAGTATTSKEVKTHLPEGYSAPKNKGRGRSRKRRVSDPQFPIFQAQGGEWKLSIAERKRILLNNIHGVDIDPQAVEVTKLSLHFKVLEGENRETISKQLKLFQERALPDLRDNIKCGNSLIGPDFYDGQSTLLDEDEMRRINTFDWVVEFSEIMGNGGFDAVIGNPPYVRQEMLSDLKEYFAQNYQVYHGVADLYTYFIEKGVSLLLPRGIFSYIVANKWMRANYGLPLRVWLKGQHIEEIVDFGDLQVFQKATTYPCILRISKEASHDSFGVAQMKTLSFANLSDYVEEHRYQVQQFDLDDTGWSLVDESVKKLLEKLRRSGVPLGEYVNGKIYYGIKTGLNEAFVIDEETRARLIAEDPRSEELIKPFLAGRDIKRYQPPKSNRYLIFTRRGVKIKDYPAIKRYLSQFKERLTPKPKDWKGDKWIGRKPGIYQWYEIQDTVSYYEEFEKPKIMYLVFQVKPAFTFDEAGTYGNNAIWITPNADQYLLSILNSKLGWFLISNYCTQIQNGYQLIFKYLGKVPIHTIDFSDSEDVASHDRMVQLVENMLELNKKLAETKTGHEKTLLQRQIDATDHQIDRLVYDLYDLTEEEVKIVEEASG